MPCLPCQKARQRLKGAVRGGDLRGAAQAIELGARIALLKQLGYDERGILQRLGDALGMTEEEVTEVIHGKAKKKA